MTRRLFPAIYRVAEGGDRPPPLVTLLAYPDGLKIVGDERVWMELLEVRNALVHAYPTTDEERALATGRAQRQAGTMLVDHAAALEFVRRQRFMGETA